MALTFIVPVHADEGNPRYVAGNGSDASDCTNRFRPCRTLAHAIAAAGKGDSVLVAEGDYAVRSADDLNGLLSVQGRIAAGYSGYSAYSERNAVSKTTLVGVPAQLRERYQDIGFSVIVDTKSFEEAVPDETARSSMLALASTMAATAQSHAGAPCTGGSSSGFACDGVGLLAHAALQDMEPAAGRASDIWGFVDLNTAREYVIVGLQTGVAVFDVSNPEMPVQVGSAEGTASTWRDIKVLQQFDAQARRWRAYAYITADNVPDGLLVLDLSGLPNSIEAVSFASDFANAHNVYLAGVDYRFGLARGGIEPLMGIAGANLAGGNFRLYSLSQPAAPSLVSVSTQGYAHDLASVALTDARKDSQCVNALAADACELLADFNENTVDIWDVTQPNSPQRLSSFAYSNASYVHSGWFTEDARYLLVQDELDEGNAGLNTTVRVLDLANLSAPSIAGSWVGPNQSIDHNGFAKGNRYYLANYASGLSVLDISDPSVPQRIGFFDSFPAHNAPAFVGAWGAYPFLASGTIAVSDINSGLYLLEDETPAPAAGSFVITTPVLAGAEGGSVDVVVSRVGGSTGAVSVDIELLAATADGADVSLNSTSLTWADGETQDRSITVDLIADALSEELETLLLNLTRPAGGATLSSPDTAAIHIHDVGAPTRLRMLDVDPLVDEARGEALVVVTRHGSTAGEARVFARTVANAAYDGFTPVDTELVWADGDAAAKTLAVALQSNALPASETGSFDLELFTPTGATLEDGTGNPAATLTTTVTVSSAASLPPVPAPTPTPVPSPQPGGGGGGGGAAGLPLLFALLGLAVLRRRYR